MKTNLFRCGKPGEANQMALRYIFENASNNGDAKTITAALVHAITGFDTSKPTFKIIRVWPLPIEELGLNVEIYFGIYLFHLAFFFFGYDSTKPIEEEMRKATSCIRGDADSKGCYLIFYRSEDMAQVRLRDWKENEEETTHYVTVNGKLVYDAIGGFHCADPIVEEYLDYVRALNQEMTTVDWGKVWRNSPVGFGNYVKNYLSPLFLKRFGDGASLSFLRTGWKSAHLHISIDTGFELYDLRSERVDSWLILEFLLEFPAHVATVRVLGDCFCFEQDEGWMIEDARDEAFFRMRKVLDQEGSLFRVKGGTSEPESLVGELREGIVPLEEDAWQKDFPHAVFELIDNVMKLLGKR